MSDISFLDEEIAEGMSFWSLIEKERILIPEYQREYAQGRINRRAELIRNGFVSSLYNSLEKNEKLELDFIFGGNESNKIDEFEPVDGQQRLTILFLLHWYVFMRANDYEKLNFLGEKFCYKTRTTSETFCKKMCVEKWSFGFDQEELQSQISKQIKKKPWFTGTMGSDPTVLSMLVVIDTIHEQFDKNEDCDYKEFVSRLVNENCPIKFYYLVLKKALCSDSSIRDLYIKMNARGIALTDFEVFKADLQKKDDSCFDLLAGYLAENDTVEARANVIAKFNNEYTNLFFNLIDNGEIIAINSPNRVQMFDVSMMNFINEFFRMNYYCAISEAGVGQKDYRNDHDVFRKMSGREFSDFIRSLGKNFNEKYFGSISDNTHILASNSNERTKDKAKDNIERSKDTYKKTQEVFISTFKNIIEFLDKIVPQLDIESSEKNFSFDFGKEEKCCYSITEKMKEYARDPQGKNAPSFAESLVRMGMYEFILKYGIPANAENKEAFKVWCRFVWKIDKNSDFRNFDEAVQTLRGFKKIIDLCGEKCTNESVLNAVLEFSKVLEENSSYFGGPARLQLMEETIKASLSLDSAEWKDILLEAEDYFNSRGQLWFLLNLSDTDSGYNLDRFKKAFKITKEIFDSSYKTKDAFSTLFERALLAEKGPSCEFENKDHLILMGGRTTETKKFVTPNYAEHISHKYCESGEQKEKDEYNIVKALFNEMISDTSEINNVKALLQSYIDNGSSTVDWKNIFIKYDLIGKRIPGLNFQNRFEPDAWEAEGGYKYTALYTTSERRGRNSRGELHSFLLASILMEKNINVEYTVIDGPYIIEPFTSRFFTAKGYDIGYIKGEYWRRKHDTDEVPTKIGDLNEALNWVSKLSD